MDLDARIEYWRGRARVAKRAALQEEERMCGEIVRILVAHRKDAGQVERKVGDLMDAMPIETAAVQE